MNKLIKTLACCALAACVIVPCVIETKRDEKRAKANQERIDSTKVTTHCDTVVVLDYKPCAKHVPSTTIVSNKSGKTHKWHERENLPVERGDEIVINVNTYTPPEDQGWTTYQFVKNLTTEKLKQEYMKQH